MRQAGTITDKNSTSVIANVRVDEVALWPPNDEMNTMRIGYDGTDVQGTPCALAVKSSEGASGQGWQILDPRDAPRRRPGPHLNHSGACHDSGGAIATPTESVVALHNL